MSARNIVDYTAKYRLLPFEAIQLTYRRKRVLAEISTRRPTSLLEIGCGELPLFSSIAADWDMCHTVVEPSPEFALNAASLAEGRDNIQVIQGLLEDFDARGNAFDMVIASCVLHEVQNPRAFLDALRRLCAPSTLVHINVPNAQSLHRLLAVAMGLISHTGAQSAMQRLMQQRVTTYNLSTLRDELNRAGFSVIESGSLFVKPFTHVQMQQLVDNGFMTSAMLDGLDKLVEILPNLGSEIWVNVKRTDGA